MNAPTYGSLFSGYGGLDLAVEAVLGAEAAWHCELDTNASKVLEAHWPGVPNLGDISAVDWSQVQPVDVLCGGFPCQDISSAGKGAGIKEGTRSGLWYRFADAIRVLRPRLVFVENVSALVVRGLDIVAADLAALGYGFTWDCVRASDIGACHRRERLFLLAWPASDADHPAIHGQRARSQPWCRGALAPDADGEVGRRNGKGSRPSQVQGPEVDGWPTEQPGRCGSGDSGEESLARWGRYASGIARWEVASGRPAPDPTDHRGRLNPLFPEWMMGLPAGWVTDLLPHSAALKAIGNGVVPQQAAHALTTLHARIPTPWICPCRTCPHCGWIDEDQTHPDDGMTSFARCVRCGQHDSERWVHVGPFMDGLCPSSAREADEWSAHDSLVMAGSRPGDPIKREAS